MEMKAARLHQYNQALQMNEVDVPKPIGEGVLVKVAAAGICHSDIHLIKGDWKDILPMKFPKTLGHESAGYVEEMGESAGIEEGRYCSCVCWMGMRRMSFLQKW